MLDSAGVGVNFFLEGLDFCLGETAFGLNAGDGFVDGADFVTGVHEMGNNTIWDWVRLILFDLIYIRVKQLIHCILKKQQ